MKVYKYLVIILFIIIVILAYRETGNKAGGIIKLPARDITIKEHYTPVPIYTLRERKMNTDTVWQTNTDTLLRHLTKADSNNIISEFLRKIAYADTLMNNDTAFILVVDTIQGNRIKNREKIIRIHPIVVRAQPYRSLYIGGGLGGNANKFLFSAGAMYKDRKDRIYNVTYYPLDKTIQFSVYFSIFRSK